MQTQNLKFTELRQLALKIEASIKNGYLDSDYKKEMNDFNHIVETESGYFALVYDCIHVECADVYFHETMDEGSYRWDKINEQYIFDRDAIYVQTVRGYYYTHAENEGSNIFYHDGEYVDQDYIDHYDLVFEVNGDLVSRDDVYYWESDGEYHYEAERNEEDEEDEEIIKSYNYKPCPKFFLGEKEKEKSKNLFLGLELEVENEEGKIYGVELAEKIESDHLYFKRDGSLNNGFEIVTHPLSFEWIEENRNKFSNMLKLSRENGFRSFNSSTCGMHIHLSKSSFGAWHLYRFLKFFQENKEFIVAISQRKIENLKRWANLEDESNESLIYKAKRKYGNDERYVAVNLHNSRTIELRIFRGTLNENSFFKNIEFAHAVFTFSRDCNDMTLASFKKFISTKSEYNHLSKFIKLKNL